jgi:hypothetical protein
MTDRLSVDQITSDQLDHLYDDRDRLQIANRALNTATVETMERAERAEAERDGAYRERAQLLALLAALHPSVIAPAPDVDEDGWQILYLQIGGKQASWHITPRDAALYAHVEHVPADDRRAQWDGHTTEQKYQHIGALAARLYAESRGLTETPLTPSAEAALDRVRALHHPTGVVAATEHGNPPDCAACGPNCWPCPTYQATEPAATQATDTRWQPDVDLDYTSPPPPASNPHAPLRTGTSLNQPKEQPMPTCTATIEGPHVLDGGPVRCTREAGHPENHVGPERGDSGRTLWNDHNAGATPHDASSEEEPGA